MTQSVKVNLAANRTLKAIITTAFPDYRKRDAYIVPFKGAVQINSYWDGGSKRVFALVHLPTAQVKQLPTASHPFYDLAAQGVVSTENQDVSVDHVGNVTLKRLPEEFVLVEAGWFCGKAATARVHYAPTAQLPQEVSA